VKGLTAEQASWSYGKGNHSVGQLAFFWNRQNLARLKGEKPDAFNGNNEETFNKLDSKTWDGIVQQLDGQSRTRHSERSDPAFSCARFLGTGSRREQSLFVACSAVC
jgi:hypothetical protein